MPPPRSAYLHIPFCHRRCFYCDFAVVPLGDRAGAAAGAPGAASIAAYLQLLHREIEASPQGPPLSTVYLGGGTPSLLSPDQVQALLQHLQRRYGLAGGCEITLELDPASFDERRLQGYLDAGVNRVSLGGQSFDDAALEALGRRHRRCDLLQAIAWLTTARQGGALRSWSLDLIQALPGQSLDQWQQQLEQAVASDAPHLSVYELTLEPGTVFARRSHNGTLELPDEDLAADLHACTHRCLTGAGYGHYEVSNYALPGHASRHNRVYWSGAHWWGFGMGATSCASGERCERPRTRDGYGAWVETLPQPLPPERPLPLDERLLVGLRRREGVLLEPLLSAAASSALRRLLAPELASGLLLIEGPRWRLSDPVGLALSNAVLRKLLSWWEHAAPAPTAAGPAEPAAAAAPGVGQRGADGP